MMYSCFPVFFLTGYLVVYFTFLEGQPLVFIYHLLFLCSD